MGMRRRQRGLSMIGFLFVAAVVLVVALLAFRMIPAYIEYYSVEKALQGAMADTNDLTLASVRRAVDRRLGADYVDSVQASDVQLTKNGNTFTAEVAWEKRLPLVYNVSLVLDFNATASR
jgi:Tfp pilus assembly protein PilV